MTSRRLLAGFLFLSLAPGALLAASAQSSSSPPAPDHSRQIESLQRQFLATTDASQRNHLLGELKSAARQPADAAALNAAVTAMLPAATSVAQASQLLAMAAANPAVASPADSSPDDDREFLADARSESQAASPSQSPQSQSPQPDVEALADIRIDRLHNGGERNGVQDEAHVQQLWRINTVQGARSFTTHTLMYASMSERLCLIRARVLQPGGGELSAQVSDDQTVEDLGSSMYFDSLTRDLRFPRLQPGDLVEIEYRLLPTATVNPWAAYYARMDLFGDAFATRLRRRVLIAPSDLPLYAVEQGLPPASVQEQGGETTRVWEMHDIPPAPSEALSPGASSLVPYLHVSTIGSLEEFGRWYSALLQPALELDDNLREQARQILARNLTTQAKVQAVYESVQRNTAYVAFEFGAHSYQPYPLATVDQRGFGDCKDKAAMIVALLRAVGVDAEFAMVRTRSAGEVDPAAYSLQLFNHALAYVPALDLFLDGTVDYAAPGELPPDDQGAVAMTVDAAGQVTRRIVPFTPPAANRVTRQVQARLLRDGRVQFVSQTRYAGYFAAVERRSSQSRDLAGSSQAALARFYPSVRVAHAVAEGTARASREVELKVEGEIDAPARLSQILENRVLDNKEAADHPLPGEEAAEIQPANDPPEARTATLRSSLHTAALTAKYAGLPTRQNPLLLPASPSEQEVFEYELPPGSQVRLPADTRLQTPFGRVDINYRLDSGKLRVETYTELVPLTVEPEDYPAFRAFCQAADRALQRQVAILLP
jgi:transglutaminase-like putative cysteine protease